jgi:uncharacterized protein YkwD
MPRRPFLLGLSAALLLVCPSAATAAPAAPAAPCANADVIPSAANIAAVESATQCLVNLARRHRGLPALRRNPQLDTAAVGHSSEMVSDGYFSHGDAAGGGVDTRADHAGYLPDSGPWVVGEALAWAVNPNGTPRTVVNAWMHSAKHRQQLLYTDFRQVGIGIAVGVPANPAGPGATYTADFGAKGAELTRARKRHHATRHASGDQGRCSPTSTSAIDFCG